MCYSNDVKEVFICRCVRSPARCTAARVRFRAATTFQGKIAALCPEDKRWPADPAIDFTTTKDFCAWCWEDRRRIHLAEALSGRVPGRRIPIGTGNGSRGRGGGRGGRGDGNGATGRGGAAASVGGGQGNGEGEDEEEEEEDEDEDEKE